MWLPSLTVEHLRHLRMVSLPTPKRCTNSARYRAPAGSPQARGGRGRGVLVRLDQYLDLPAHKDRMPSVREPFIRDSTSKRLDALPKQALSHRRPWRSRK